MRKLILLICLVLAGLSANSQVQYITVTGATDACPGTTNSYQVLNTFAVPACFYKPFTANWSVVGGVFRTTNLNTSFVLVEWTTNGPKSITATIFEPFTSCPNTVSATMSGINMLVPFGAPTPNDPVSIVPSNTQLCPVPIPLTPNSLTSTTLTLGNSALVAGTELVWEYSLNGGSTQSLATTTTPSYIFTIPPTAQPNDSYVFSVYSRYSICPNIRSVSRFSVPVVVLPAAPTFTLSKTDQICATSGAFQITGISTSASNVYIRIRDAGSLMPLPSFPEGIYSKSNQTLDVPPGSYEIQIQNHPNGCFVNSQTINVNIQQVVNSLTVTPTPTNPLCSGGLGSILTSASNTTGAVSFSLSDSPYNATNPNPITGLSANTYTVYATDVNGCKGNANTTINDPTAITITSASVTSGVLANHNGRDISCIGANDGQITITASGGTGSLQYSIDNGVSYSASGVFNSLSPANYSIKVKDLNGCVKDGPTITVSNPPALNSGTTSIIHPQCVGATSTTGSISITGISGGTPGYTWQIYNLSNVAVSASTAVASAISVAAGTYYAKVTDANGCSVNTSNFVVNAPIAASYTSVPASCAAVNDGSLTITGVTGGNGSYTYSINNGAFGASTTFSSLATGATYVLKVKDGNGCEFTINNAAVALQPSITGTISQTSFINCFGQSTASISVTASGGTAPYTYSWSNSVTTQNNPNIPAGSYNVTITDSKTCTGTASISVSQPTALTVTPSVTNISCKGGNNGSINLVVNGGTGIKTFLWSNGATSQNISGLAPGSYSVTVTDANGCINNIHERYHY